MKYIFLLLVPAFLFSCSPREEAGREEGTSGTEVTLTEGTNMSAAISPDNRTLAMGLQGIIWTLPAGGGKATAITEAIDDCHEPTWSPTGERIAYYCYRSGNFNVWISDADGRNRRQITDDPHDDRDPTWSPEGKSIIFSSDRSGNYDLWKVNLKSGKTRQITTHKSSDHSPSVSSGDGSIAFISNRKKEGVYVKNNSRIFLTAPYSKDLESPSWNPSGNRIVFVGYSGKSSGLYNTNRESKKISEVGSVGRDIFPFSVSWIDKDTFIYTADGKIKSKTIGKPGFRKISFKANISVNDPNYKGKEYNFDSRKENKVRGITGPTVSPSGKKVAFTALGDIYVKNIDGKITNVTNDPSVDIDPDWSPDGSKLAYVSDRGGKMQIWIRDLQSGETRLLSDEINSGVAAPSWSPSGEKIAFHAIGHKNVWGNGVLHVADVSTGEVTAVHEPVFGPGKPSWSPDGKYIAMMALDPSSSRYREGINKFLIVPVDGGPSRFVSPNSGRSLGMRTKNGPIWSPDGQKMAYVQDGVLWTVPVDERGEVVGPPTQITKELSSKISWAGDSEHIVYISGDNLKRVNVETHEHERIEIGLKWKRNIPNKRYIIHAERLFTGTDSTYRKNVDIIIEGNRINGIRKHKKHPNNIDVVDASGKTVMPGMFEMHAHLHNSANVKLGRIFLSYGITSVRETGADPYDALERKESWSSGKRPGPREFFTGGLMDGRRVYYALANSIIREDHLDMELSRAEELGYALIKTYVRMPNSMQKKVIGAAHEMGVPVSSHEIYPAAKFGIDATEHLSGTSRLGYSPKLSNLNNTYGDVIDIITESKMNITPTMVMYGGYLRMALKTPSLLDHPQINACSADEYVQEYRNRLSNIRASGSDPGSSIGRLQETVAEIVHEGGNVTAGTDVPFLPFGSSLHAEVWLYAEGGLTPFQALQTATINAAKSVGVAEDLGSIEKGKLADLIIVNGDPLHNIKETLNVEKTIKNGNVYDVDDLISGCR